MSEGRTATLGAASLLVVAAAYFALGRNLTFETIDEGHLAYDSLRVAQGALPYQDFHHIYGPSVFLLNGLLLRLWEPDLGVIRMSLVVLKAGIALLVYLLARQIASRPFALLGYAVVVVMWGTPWWVFNTPYANHYGLALTLAGLWAFLSLPRRSGLGCGLAGVCFGLAATFKLTVGAFGLAGFILFLILAEDPGTHGDLSIDAMLPVWWVRVARLVLLGGIAVPCIVYLLPRNSLWNVAVLGTPLALTLVVATVGELRRPPPSSMRAALWGTAYALAGAMLPLIAVVIAFGAKGLLGQLLFDSVHGLPQKIEWFTPYPIPNQQVLLSLVLLSGGVTLVALRRRYLRFIEVRRAVLWTALGVGSAALLLVGVIARTQVRDYVSGEAWKGDALALWFAVPLAALLLTGAWLLRSRLRASGSPPRRRAVLLLYCNAVTALLLLYPAADFFHVIMDLPVFAPLLAFVAEHFCHAGEPHGYVSTPGRYLSWALVGALAIWLVAPAIDHLVVTVASSHSGASTLRRAAAIRGTPPKFSEVASLVAYLDSELPPQQDLLVLSCEQMLYFLSGRRSALERDEFVFYLLAFHGISDDNARALVDQREAVARLADVRPVVVEGGDSPAHDRLREVFPEVSRYIDAHYDTAASVGSYRVLTWAR